MTDAATDTPPTGTPTAKQWWPFRYGPDDQAGARNEITPEAVLRGVHLAREGRVFDLTHVLHAGVPVFPGRPPGAGRRHHPR